MGLLEPAGQQRNTHFHYFTKIQNKITPSMRVYCLYYRRLCNNQAKMAEGRHIQLSRKEQMNRDSKVSDPRKTLHAKGKTSGIKLPSNLHVTLNSTAMHRELSNINIIWQL
jgi:hypothetical protein